MSRFFFFKLELVKFLLILCTFHFFQVSAVADSNNSWDIQGFGTIGGAYQDNKDTIYRSGFQTYQGSQGNFSFATDSKIGLQLNSQITDDLTMTIQGMASQFTSDNILLNLEWANLKYKFTENLSIRIGRMRTPVFMYSDILNVSYSYTWVRLPQEVYSTFPLPSYDGIELNYNFLLDEYFFSIKGVCGQTKTDIIVGYDEDTASKYTNKEYRGVTLDVSTDNFEFRMSYFLSNGSMEDKKVNEYLSALRKYGFNDLADKYTIDNKKFEFFGLAMSYSFNNAFIVGEYTKIKSDSMLGAVEGAYLSVGYNFNEITPYLIVAESSKKKADIENTIPKTLSYLPLQAATSKILRDATAGQKSKSIGVRYDFADNMALKLQYDYIEVDEEQASIHIRFNNNYDNLKVFSATIDFLF